MPGDHAAVTRGLAKELIVPEPHGAPEKLRRGDCESRVPEYVVKPGRDAPCPQRMKEGIFGVFRFVRVKLVKEVVPRVRRVFQLLQFFAEDFYLLVVEQADSGDVAVLF